MRKSLACVALLLVLGAQPADAFSLKTPFKKAGHVLKVTGQKIGDGLVWATAAFAAVAFCVSTGQCE